jgi:endonuclease/exonuclease/phosphatase (EEP) superfamily protein YafD
LRRTDEPAGRTARRLFAACGFPAAALAAFVWFAFLIGHLGTLLWPLDLLANFRVQYMGLFALCVVALTIARWRKMAIVALLGVAATTASMARYFPEAEHSVGGSVAFKLLTFNLWFRNDDVQRVASFLERSQADVIVLQEVDLSRLDELSRKLPSYPYHSQTPNVRRGLVLFSRTALSDVEHFEIPARVTRITRAKVAWRGANISVIGTHLRWPVSPAKARQRAWELGMIADRVRLETGPVVVAGDMNLTPWSRFFARFVERSGLRDCALGQGLLPTWPSQFIPVRIRIDHCFASSHWQVRNIDVASGLGSDHLPQTIDLELRNR